MLLASDSVGSFDMPAFDRTGSIGATATCLAVPVRHAADVVTPPGWPDDRPLPEATVSVTVVVGEQAEDERYEYEGVLRCDSGRLAVGDGDNERLIAVPARLVCVRVRRHPIERSEWVSIRIGAVNG